MTIPAGVEKLILEGRAVNRVVTHKADRFFINPPESGFIIVYGFEFIPPLESFDAEVEIGAFSIQVASDKGVDYYQHNVWPTANYSNGRGLKSDPVTHHSVYICTESSVQFNVFATGLENPPGSLEYGTIKDDGAILNNYPPEFAAAFTDNDPAIARLKYLVALDLPINPAVGVAAVYYPFGSEYTEQFFGTAFSGVGFDSWLLAPNGVNGVYRYNNSKAVQNGKMVPFEAFGITVHYAIVGEKLPPKTAKGWIIEKD